MHAPTIVEQLVFWVQCPFNSLTAKCVVTYHMMFPPAELTTAIESSYTPEPVVVQLGTIFDIKTWMLPHLEDLHGHSTPLCFKFEFVHNIVKMFFRHWSSDPWSQEGVSIFKVRFTAH